MADVANVINGKAVSDGSDAMADLPELDEQQAAAPPQRVWSMPKSPVSRKRADEWGRIAVKAVRNIAVFVAEGARLGARIVTTTWHAIEAIPKMLQLFVVASLLMLLGLVGSIALHNSAGLICTVVVVPMSSIILGALGYRWYIGVGNPSARDTKAHADAPAISDLQRSVEYVDKKLAVALTSFGTEHHQQAVIALFQAKTAVELALGTEQDPADQIHVPLPADGQNLRPRIRVESTSKSLLRENNSLAAS